MPNLRNTKAFREELLAALGVTDDHDVENENNFKSALLDALNVDHIPQDVSNFEKFREKLIEAADGIGSGGGGGGEPSIFSEAELTLIFTGTDAIEVMGPVYDSVLERTFGTKVISTSNSVVKIIKCQGGAIFALYDITNSNDVVPKNVTMAGDINAAYGDQFKITGNASITYNYSA